jgi:hypothetical protein
MTRLPVALFNYQGVLSAFVAVSHSDRSVGRSDEFGFHIRPCRFHEVALLALDLHVDYNNEATAADVDDRPRPITVSGIGTRTPGWIPDVR